MLDQISESQDLGSWTSLLWLLLAAIGTVSGLATIFGLRRNWPPRTLHFTLGASVIGLAIITLIQGLPPLLFDPAGGQPNTHVWELELRRITLVNWLALVGACGFALAFHAGRAKHWWRLAGYLLLVVPLPIAANYGQHRWGDPMAGWPETEADRAFLNSLHRDQYLIGLGALAVALVVFFLLDQKQRRASPRRLPG